MSLIANNPICWVSFRLGGGWRKIGLVVVVYAAVLLGITFFVLQTNQQWTISGIASGWLPVLQVLQMFSLAIVGCSSIRRQIQRDFTSRMIESHRLTPMSGVIAAIGYTLGPNLILLAFNVAVLLSGMILTPLAGKPVGDWLLFNGILAWLTLLVWILSVFLSLATGGTFSFLAMAVIAVLSGAVVLFLPGLALLMGLYGFTDPAKGALLQLTTTDLTLPCMLLQALVGALCLYGAARKFRGLQIRAFPVGVGLLLVVVLAAAGALGLMCAEGTPRMFGAGPRMLPDSVPLAFKLGISLLAVNLAALNPVATAGFQFVTWRRQRRLEPQRPLRRPLGMLLTALLAVILTMAVFQIILRLAGSSLCAPDHHRQWLLSGVLLLLPLLSTGSIMQITYRAADRARWVAVVWLTVLSIGPVIMDGLYMASQMLTPFHFTWLTCVSPVGAMLMLWQPEQEGSAQIGLLVQAAITALLVVLLLLTGRNAPAEATAG